MTTMTTETAARKRFELIRDTLSEIAHFTREKRYGAGHGGLWTASEASLIAPARALYDRVAAAKTVAAIRLGAYGPKGQERDRLMAQCRRKSQAARAEFRESTTMAPSRIVELCKI
jgi:hypothetical protein